jgi:hypothetical protein
MLPFRRTFETPAGTVSRVGLPADQEGAGVVDDRIPGDRHIGARGDRLGRGDPDHGAAEGGELDGSERETGLGVGLDVLIAAAVLPDQALEVVAVGDRDRRGGKRDARAAGAVRGPDLSERARNKVNLQPQWRKSLPPE